MIEKDFYVFSSNGHIFGVKDIYCVRRYGPNASVMQYLQIVASEFTWYDFT